MFGQLYRTRANEKFIDYNFNGDRRMTVLFFCLCVALILAEFVKGLSANGTPPVLQSYPWQMDLAYFMWSNIAKFRIVLLILIGLVATQLTIAHPIGFGLGLVLCMALWGGIYWLFNKFWVGKYKFLPITQKTFLTAQENKVDPSTLIIGVDINGEQRAYPANLLFYHHQVPDEVGGQPILATYCGMCRSGRVFDTNWDIGVPEFQLVGAVSYNAVLRDSLTNSWWRQETGEAAKGPKQGEQLEDIYFEQMTLEHWIEKHPETLILQYDPVFQRQYNFLGKLLNYEASFPGWYRQETPPLIIGVDIEGQAKAYDLSELHKKRMIVDDHAGTPLLVLSDPEGRAAFVYNRNLGDQTLSFESDDNGFYDVETGSRWNDLGRCTEGSLKGQSMTQLQSYQQFVRAWITFHPETEFYTF